MPYRGLTTKTTTTDKIEPTRAQVFGLVAGGIFLFLVLVPLFSYLVSLHLGTQVTPFFSFMVYAIAYNIYTRISSIGIVMLAIAYYYHLANLKIFTRTTNSLGAYNTFDVPRGLLIPRIFSILLGIGGFGFLFDCVPTAAPFVPAFATVMVFVGFVATLVGFIVIHLENMEYEDYVS